MSDKTWEDTDSANSWLLATESVAGDVALFLIDCEKARAASLK
jgi:hypothetical protein